MRIRLSDATSGIMGVVGHAGCGHAHSNHGFVQDDSAGLAALLMLFQEATGLPLTIRSVTATPGICGGFEVRTVSGGVGRATARRGVTLQEARLARAAEGQEAIRTQTLALEAFGRMYGQGAHEAPVALQTAIANAAIDSFAQNYPKQFHVADEALPGNCGTILGTVLDIEGIAVSAMGLSNATIGGIGPNEDLEGNAYLYGKKKVMEPLQLHSLPTIVVEGKVYSSALCDSLVGPQFLVRASIDDNPLVANALMGALADLDYPATYPKDALKRVPKALTALTQSAGECIIAFGKELQKARTSAEKVDILARLNAYTSQDVGGLSFMSDALHEVVSGPGVMPGTSAVLSLLMPKSYADLSIIPYLTESDMGDYIRILKQAVTRLAKALPEANAYLQQHACTKDLNFLVE